MIAIPRCTPNPPSPSLLPWGHVGAEASCSCPVHSLHHLNLSSTFLGYSPSPGVALLLVSHPYTIDFLDRIFLASLPSRLPSPNTQFPSPPPTRDVLAFLHPSIYSIFILPRCHASFFARSSCTHTLCTLSSAIIFHTLKLVNLPYNAPHPNPFECIIRHSNIVACKFPCRLTPQSGLNYLNRAPPTSASIPLTSLSCVGPVCIPPLTSCVSPRSSRSLTKRKYKYTYILREVSSSG